MVGDDAVRRAPVADAPGQPPRVDPRDRRRCHGTLSQGSSDWVGAVIGGLGDRRRAPRPRAAGVVVSMSSCVGADIADMGKGEGDDLPGIGRIGQDFLIAGDRGVEADFADRRPGAPMPRPQNTVPSASTRAALQSGGLDREREWRRASAVPRISRSGHQPRLRRPRDLGPRIAGGIGTWDTGYRRSRAEAPIDRPWSYGKAGLSSSHERRKIV